jgi:hypothetical protein
VKEHSQNTFLLALAAFLFVCCCLIACHKDPINQPPPVVPPPDTIASGTLKINLVISGPESYVNWVARYEVIISEPSGKVLLDTVMAPGTKLTTSLSTNATLVDLTNVYYDSSVSQYTAVTYKGVNPSGWVNNFSRSYIAPLINNYDTVHAVMAYTNVPSIDNFLFSQNAVSQNNQSDTLDWLYKTISLTYLQIAGNYAYALWPTVSLYNFHIPKGILDTVDCTILDTAVTLNFPASPNYTFAQSTLYGYMDTTNINSSMWLYDYYVNPLWTLPDLEYPNKLIEKYALETTWNSTNKETVNTYDYSGSVPASFTLPDPGSYSIGSGQNSNFAVNFTAAKPTYYYTSWQNAASVWTLYASPDSSNLQPLNLLTAQKSKLLQGQSLGTLALKTFQFENVAGYNYAGFLGLVCDTVLLGKTRVVSAVSYAKSF